MTSAMHIAPLTDNTEVISALSDIIIEVVANGGSVSFMHPLSREVATTFWRESLARTKGGGRVVLGAYEGDYLIGTVTPWTWPLHRTSRIAPRSPN